MNNNTGKFTITSTCNVKNFNVINVHYTKFLAYENKKKIVVSNKR